ncbi:MAG: DUF928 domain-containing protein [Chroococcidiopsidaceae cyanobacterium CP_BM_ER_R8_30]|nr:DUF928 domain-containing protein [Chroococcidiopsidaceae cyanobacterium CP_BM_ER_R8_30]
MSSLRIWLTTRHKRGRVIYSSVYSFYVPKTAARAWEFVLQDANDEQFYKATFKPTDKPGVVSLSLPANSTKASLEIGKLLIC